MYRETPFEPAGPDFEAARAALLAAIDPAALGLCGSQRRPAVQRHAKNPFVEELDLKTKRNREALLRSAVTGAAADAGVEKVVLEVDEVRYVDRAGFVKVFRAALRAAFDLPPAGAKVFFLALALLACGGETVDLRWKKQWDAADAGGPVTLSRVTLWRGITALVDVRFLLPAAEQGRYWINPARMFAGDRIRLKREYRLKPGAARPA